LGVVALAFVGWQYVRQAPPIAVAQDKTITVFAAASMTNALDDVDAAFTKQTVSRSSLATMRARH
jgi:ABC-type molybdate transport system substrate-binding protein